MIEYVNEREKKDLPYRRIPNNLCKYSVLKLREPNAQLLKCELDVMTSSQILQYRNGEHEELYSVEPDKQ